jgi:TorA maturation chaperone TorD
VDEFQQLAQSRSRFYGFLSALYLRIPNQEFAANLLGDKFLPFLRSITGSDEVPRQMNEGLRLIEEFVTKSKGHQQSGLAEELGVDWTRLFRGLKRGYGPPPPYESVYREGSEQDGRQTIGDVTKTYREVGAGMGDQSGQRADYIGIELDFMRYLTEKETEGWKKLDYREALKCLTSEKDFLAKHIMQWVQKFCDTVLTEARTDFFRGVARLTIGFLMLEEENINEYIGFAARNLNHSSS